MVKEPPKICVGEQMQKRLYERFWVKLTLLYRFFEWSKAKMSLGRLNIGPSNAPKYFVRNSNNSTNSTALCFIRIPSIKILFAWNIIQVLLTHSTVWKIYLLFLSSRHPCCSSASLLQGFMKVIRISIF